MILIVDDTPITARWVGYVAQHLGFNAVLASNAEEALNCLADGQFVTVISDIEMPGMSGFELLQNIRLRYPDMPVILMSAFWDRERHEAARTFGAQGTLQKPVNADQLTELFGGGPQTIQSNAPEQFAPALSVDAA